MCTRGKVLAHHRSPNLDTSPSKLRLITCRVARTLSQRQPCIYMASASPSEGGPGGPCLAWAWMDVMELAGRLAQQHAQELKEVLRLEGDRANQARTQLQALAQALHDILSTSTSSDGEERGGDGAMAMEEEVEERSLDEVSLPFSLLEVEATADDMGDCSAA
jgi:hypothetical protein